MERARFAIRGFLVQTRDNGHIGRADLKIVTKRQPTEVEIADMLFAFTIAKHVKSNTIVYAKNGQTAGIGAGQMSRVDSARIAAIKAREAGRKQVLLFNLSGHGLLDLSAYESYLHGKLQDV